MTISTATKIGAAGTVTAGGGATGLYFAQDYIKYYEVERKVMDENVVFAVTEDSGNDVDSNKAWKIAATGSGFDANTSWECVVVGKTGVVITKVDLEVRLLDIFGGNTKETRRKLVEACSKNRTEKTSNKVKSKVVFGKGHASGDWKQDNWDTYLFGPSILGETEKEALKDVVYFEVTDKQDTTPLKIKAKSTDSKWADNEGYSWQCAFPTTTDIVKSKLDPKLPTEQNKANIDSNKKANKTRLIYFCSKYKSKESSGKQITATVSYDIKESDLTSTLMFTS